MKIDTETASPKQIAEALLRNPTKAAAVAALIAARVNVADLEGPLSAAVERLKSDPAGAAMRALFGG